MEQHPQLQEALARISILLHHGETDPAKHAEALQGLEEEAIHGVLDVLRDIGEAIVADVLGFGPEPIDAAPLAHPGPLAVITSSPPVGPPPADFAEAAKLGRELSAAEPPPAGPSVVEPTT